MLKRRRINPKPTVPSGMIAHTERGYFYVKGDKRFKFLSDRARKSWCLHEVETVESALSTVKVAGIVGFRDGTLIRDISNGKIYLIVDNKKKLVTDPDYLFALGLKRRDAIWVSKKEAGFQKDGEDLNG
jgi:hypothetical protein